MLRRTPLKRKKRLRVKGISDTSVIKDEIQDLLRQIVIKRDGGCILRHYPDVAGCCSGYKKDGSLILQAEHLNSRAHAHTYGDTRNVVCLCRGHHGYFKNREGKLYWELVAHHIGEKNWNWLEMAIAENHKSHKMDWKLVKLGLEQELLKQI